MDDRANILHTANERHKGHPLKIAYDLLANSLVLLGKNESAQHTIKLLSITGSAGKLLSNIFNLKHVNEIVAQFYGAQKFLPHIKTIIEMGGEDSKLIIIDSNGIKDFSMNSLCAAGTGSFLDQQAERLRLTIEEFGDLALKSKKPPRIAGRCSVFAKSDMIHLQQIATPVEDIVAGLCFAVAKNFKGTILKGRKVKPPVSFQGGVAANAGMVRAFKEVFDLKDLVVHKYFAFMGAIGAILKDLHDNTKNIFDIKLLENYLNSFTFSDISRPPLLIAGDTFMERHLYSQADISKEQELEFKSRLKKTKINAFLGIDVGSISTNLAVTDEAGRLLAKRYLMTAGRPIEAVRQGLTEIGDEIGDRVEIMGVGTTGSGRYMIADYVGADIVKNEITAQATAAAFIDKDVDTIFEIGGQDSKYICLENGCVIDFEMNKACAAGTGSFLEEQAEKLNISIKGEFEQYALSAKNPCWLGERCTVFMENSLIASLQRGAQKDNLLAGLSYSIVENYINRVVAGKRIGRNIFFQGGTAFNKSVVAAFEKYLQQKITVPQNHDVTGAIGMALIAKEISNSKPPHIKSCFRGFELSNRPYSISSFECKGCSNVCNINKVTIEGEKTHMYYGGRCEKYDIKNKNRSNIEDLFTFREEMLWQNFNHRTETNDHPSNNKDIGSTLPKIGIPYIFLFHDYLPFWTTLFYELGFEVIISPKTNQHIVNLGVETIFTEACFPVKIAHGHIKFLIENNIQTILLPSFVSLHKHVKNFDKGLACPYTQTMPYLANTTFNDLNLLRPIINFSRGDDFIFKEIKNVLKQFTIPSNRIKSAIRKAHDAQLEFSQKLQTKGKVILSSLERKTIVIVGRAYNAFDSGANLQIPQKLSTLNVRAIPMDFLPLDEIDITDKWSHMYWRNGKRILQAARFIKNHPLLYPIYISNFNCGPDSFLYEYFKDEIGNKPFLYLEIDEHSADAGIITRCEAFLDSIENKHSIKKGIEQKYTKPSNSLSSDKKIFIPRMCDHAYALAAAFEYSGISAEVLPETDKETIELGRKYVSGKQCFPCVLTIGEMLKKVFSPDFNSDNSFFFMPSGTGPCRFGQYNIFQNLVLSRCGYDNVKVFSPVQDTPFYIDLGIAGKEFIKRSWQGVLAIELLTKCLHETRPYEKEKGLTDNIYNDYLNKICNTLKSRTNGLESLLTQIQKNFKSIHRFNEKKPLIGIIGEIFVRSNKFSNENLIKKIELLGGEVWLSPPEEWIYYVNYISLKHSLIKKDISAIIRLLLKNFFQIKIEHGYNKIFNSFLKTIGEPTTKEILYKARPYIHDSFEGETILSIGKAIDLINKGVSGIINVMPFGCMPGTIVTSLMRAITIDYSMPMISVPYDGSESPTTEIQLEAFMDQAKEYRRQKEG